ncbi:hypothetical protein [Phenylobacterium sp.]|uniref:WD40 repeat domain-containing protein n=1 Tax=Phenylobacterium sp. TaxID=1871053 RepID=UPI0011F53031|nr:hypothetical protein [Phenylobacterium sp.]THD59547.1 MAG: hypothetical protein E8A49_16320 [Phenylobacterium sp.]
MPRLTSFAVHLLAIVGLLLGWNRPSAANAAAPAPGVQPMAARTDKVSTRIFGAVGVTFSPDGERLALLGFCDTTRKRLCVEVFDTRSWRPVALLDTPSERPGIIGGAVAFSPDGRRLAAGQHVLRVWTTGDWRAAFDIPGPFARGVFAADVVIGMTFTGDGKSLAAVYRKAWYPQDVTVATRGQIVDIDAARLAAMRGGEAPPHFPVDMVSFYDAATGRTIADAYPVGRDPMRGGSISAVSPVGNSSDIYAAWSKAEASDGPPPRRLAFYAGRLGPDAAQPPVALPFLEPATALTASDDGAGFIAGTSTGDRQSGFPRASGDTGELPRNNDPILFHGVNGPASTATPPSGKVIALALTSKDDVISCNATAGENGPVQVWNPNTGALTASYAFGGLSPYQYLACAIDPTRRAVAIPAEGSGTEQLLIFHVR